MSFNSEKCKRIKFSKRIRVGKGKIISMEVKWTILRGGWQRYTSILLLNTTFYQYFQLPQRSVNTFF